MGKSKRNPGGDLQNLKYRDNGRLQERKNAKNIYCPVCSAVIVLTTKDLQANYQCIAFPYN